MFHLYMQVERDLPIETIVNMIRDQNKDAHLYWVPNGLAPTDPKEPILVKDTAILCICQMRGGNMPFYSVQALDFAEGTSYDGGGYADDVLLKIDEYVAKYEPKLDLFALGSDPFLTKIRKEAFIFQRSLRNSELSRTGMSDQFDGSGDGGCGEAKG